MKPQPSIDEMRKVLAYDDETGVFKWTAKTNRRIVVGSRAGWPSEGYVVVTVMGRKIHAHRLAWAFVHGIWPSEIDHKNGIRSDNRIVNLRECTRQQNQMNRTMQSRNSSGTKGVSYDKRRGCWIAAAAVGGKALRKRCSSLEDAKAQRLAFADRLHGEFAVECREAA